MSLLHDAYTALLSGLTHRTGNKIHWHDSFGNSITIEPIDVESESYVVRYYREDGGLWSEAYYLQDQRHGKDIGWHQNAQKHWEVDYMQGKYHGKSLGWHDDGHLYWERNYHQNQLHGKHVRWYENGREYIRENYVDGKRHGKSMGWYVDGTLQYERYYINGRKATREEWEQHNDTTT